METNSFEFETEVAYTNIQPKTNTNGPLSDTFTLLPGVSTLKLLYITVAKVLAIFIDADTTIKAVKIGDHEIKQ